MTRDNLTSVRKLCAEVVMLTVAVAEETKAYEDNFRATYNMDTDWHAYAAPGSPKTGELRRRSMDLTRALAELRR